MKARWYVLVALLGLVLLAACGAEGAPGDDGVAEPSPTQPSPTETGSEAEPSPGDTSEPTAEPTEATEEPSDMDEDRGPQRELVGTLGGDQQLEGGCAWLETDGGARYEVFWPEGYHVEWDPLRLVGPDGEAVAEAGEEVTVVGAPARDMASICMVGELFGATEVR